MTKTFFEVLKMLDSQSGAGIDRLAQRECGLYISWDYVKDNNGKLLEILLLIEIEADMQYPSTVTREMLCNFVWGEIDDCQGVCKTKNV